MNSDETEDQLGEQRDTEEQSSEVKTEHRDEEQSSEVKTEQDDTVCQGCDVQTTLNALGFCNTCSDKLDRDLMRLRNWEHTTLGADLEVGERENQRRDIISQYGKELELILPKRNSSQRKKRPKRK